MTMYESHSVCATSCYGKCIVLTGVDRGVSKLAQQLVSWDGENLYDWWQWIDGFKASPAAYKLGRAAAVPVPGRPEPEYRVFTNVSFYLTSFWLKSQTVAALWKKLNSPAGT